MQYTYSYTLLIHTTIIKPIGDENSEHCLWFLVRSKSRMLCSMPIVIHMLKPIGDVNSEHCLWFLLCSNSRMLCSMPIVILYLCIYPYQSLLLMKTPSTISGFC